VVRAVLFDLDGTLWHAEHEPGEARSARFHSVQARRAKPFLAERGWTHVDAFDLVRASWAAWDEAAALPRQDNAVIDGLALTRRTFAALGLQAVEADLLGFYRLFRVAYREWPVALFEDTVGTLQRLHAARMPMALVTNNAASVVLKPELDDFRIGEFFEHIVTSTDVRFEKPSALMFARALELLGVAPAEALMVGDNFELDVRGARAMGIATVLKLNGRQPTPEGAARLGPRDQRPVGPLQPRPLLNAFPLLNAQLLKAPLCHSDAGGIPCLRLPPQPRPEPVTRRGIPRPGGLGMTFTQILPRAGL